MTQYGLIAALFALAMALLFARRKKWTLILWLPLAAVSVYESWQVLRIAGAHSGPGMEALGSLFVILAGWPWFVVALAALAAFPRRWEIVPAAVGSALIVLTGAASYLVTTRTQVVQLIGHDGLPVPHFTCLGSVNSYGFKKSLGYFTTNKTGRFSFRYDPRDSVKFEVEGTRSCYATAIYLSPIKDKSEKARVRAEWSFPGSGEFSQGSAYSFKPSSQEPILIFIKRKDHLICMSLQNRIRSFLHEVKDTGTYDETLSAACRNPESLELIDEIADMIPVHSSLRSSAIGGLENTAEVLWSMHQLNQAFGEKNAIEFSPSEEGLSAAFREWAGVTPTEDAKEAGRLIDQKIKGYADKLIARSQPYWVDENHSIAVLRGLRELGRPAIALLPEALPHAHPRAREAILRTLWDFHPTPEEVSRFISSDDPAWVVAGYSAVKDYIRHDEIPLALERLQRFSQPGSGTQIQMQIDHLLAVFRDRQK